MEKCTKFGVSAALIGMVGYFMGYYNIWYTLVLWLVILGFCTSVEAKKNVTQALVFAIFVQMLEYVCGRISNWYMDLINKIAFNEKLNINYKIIEALRKLDLFGGIIKLISLATLVLMIIFVIVAARGKKVKIPVVTKIVDKAFE